MNQEAEEKNLPPPGTAGQKKTAGSQAGKRYKCTQCGSEILVIKPGTGTLRCCGQPMQLK